MWDELLVAVGLVLVIEGLMPALNPNGFRKTVMMLAGFSNRFLRGWGLASMTIGALLVYIIRG